MIFSLTLRKMSLLFLNLAFHAFGYLGINAYLTRQGVSRDLAIALDYQIPLITYFAPFYSIVYFIPITAFFLCWDNYEMIKAAAKAFIGAGVICFACFLFYPVKNIIRVELLPPYDFFSNMLRFFYWIDDPYNCFPSLHVAFAVISAVIVSRVRPRLAPLFYFLALVVSASILFMKQHYLLDLVGGLGVSWLITAMFVPKALGSEPVLNPAESG